MANPIPLLPCSWCGAENVALIRHEDPDYEVVGCCNEKCAARGPEAYQNEAQAIASWNKGPYADRYEIHAKALTAHADQLKAQAAEHLKKAKELLARVEA